MIELAKSLPIRQQQAIPYWSIEMSARVDAKIDMGHHSNEQIPPGPPVHISKLCWYIMTTTSKNYSGVHYLIVCYIILLAINIQMY